MAFSIQDFIKLGMMRDVHKLVEEPEDGLILNLGPGEKEIPGTIPLEYPEWNADTMPIPFSDNSVDGIHAYHFFEHIKYPIEFTKEVQRVLKPGGFINIVVPYYNSNLYNRELDHKHSFTEMTFPALFRQKRRYSKNVEGFIWKLYINFNLIIGVEEPNMALYVQLVKTTNHSDECPF